MPARMIGARLRERREALGLKQREVARMAGISASYLNLIEHNRRAIAGKVLIDIAKALDIAVSSLLAGTDSDVVRRLQTAAAANPDAGAELARAQEFVGRFPGWAALTAALERRVTRLERSLEGLSDRLAHDPFLAESLHEILSSVTAIHATSGILVEATGGTGGMETLQRARFQSNIHHESARLSDLSRALVGYFDTTDTPERALSTPLDEVETFLAAEGYHFPDIGAATARDIAAKVARAPALVSDAARKLATGVLGELAGDARALPLAPFTVAAVDSGFDVATLTRRFAVSPVQVMRRLAFMPRDGDFPQVGLIGCDGTGAVLLRKAISGFPLPRYGAACALWPLYQAMTRPHCRLSETLVTGDERFFLAEAYCEYLDPASGVPVLRATMILRETARPTAPPVEVGQSCRICPVAGCLARREPSIHAP